MNMRLYTSLNGQELQDMGFRPLSPDTRMIRDMSGNPLSIHFNNARLKWFVQFGPDESPLRLPATLESLLPELGKLEFSELVTAPSPRIIGEYQHRSAIMSWEGRLSYAEATAETFLDLREFVLLFKRGDIAPVREYGQQIESVPKEFRQLVREFFALLRRELSEWKFRLDRYASTTK